MILSGENQGNNIPYTIPSLKRVCNLYSETVSQ